MSFGLTELFVPWMTGGDDALQSQRNITSHTWTTVLALIYQLERSYILHTQCSCLAGPTDLLMGTSAWKLQGSTGPTVQNANTSTGRGENMPLVPIESCLHPHLVHPPVATLKVACPPHLGAFT